MSACSKSIIECLKLSGISPTATSKTQYGSFDPQYAIDYNSNSYFNSNSDGGSQWWMVDFKKEVAIGGYSISVNAKSCDWIKKWKVSVSINKDLWTTVDTPPEGHPNGEYRELKKSCIAKYLKIESLDNVCGYVMAFKNIYFYPPSIKQMMVYCTCRNKRKIDFSFPKIIVLFLS